ncbi:MAG TPA: hypothetical protein VF941_10900 [Clostridia bacterium]
MKDFPTKRDFWYCTIIAILLMVFLLTHFAGNRSVLGAKLEFASTITSIILSVIAIIFTLVESSNAKGTSEKIIDASNIISDVTKRIDNSSNELTSITNKLTSMNLEEKLSMYGEAIKSLNEELASIGQNTSLGINEIKNTLINPSSYTQSTEADKETKKLALKYFSENVKKYASTHSSLYKNISVPEAIYIYYKIYELKLPFLETPYFVAKATKDMQEDRVKTGMHMGILVILLVLDGIYWYDNKFTMFDENLMGIVTWVEENNREFVDHFEAIVSEYKNKTVVKTGDENNVK